MKFKLKALAAALALAAVAGQASAALDNGATGNGELFLNVWNTSKSYTLDLNITMDDFLAEVGTGGHNTWAADANMTSFLSGASGMNWDVLAGGNDGGSTGTFRIIATNTAPLLDNTAKGDGVTRSGEGKIAAFANAFNTAAAGADSFITTATAANTYFGKTTTGGIGGDNLLNNIAFHSGTAMGSGTSSLSVAFLEAQSSGTTLTPYAQLGNSATFSLTQTGNLSFDAVAAVPEPETYGMLAAGLLMLGAVARRRNRA
jgi:hypothetical protein